MASTLPQLLKAIQAGNAQEVKRILTYNPSLAHQKQARDGHTPLHVAAGTGNLPIVRELLQAGASCQETDANLEVPLHIACRQRNGAAVVKDLLSDAGRRSCLKALNREGATPLHVAVQAGLLDVAQLLVNAGAKVDATDRSGRTPLDYVDPRLPGLAEILEAGRQLTPSRPSAAGASGGPSATAAGSTVSPGYHKSHPHPHGPQHQGYHHLTGSTTGNKQRHQQPGTSPHLPAVSSPAGALPGGAFNRGGAAAAAAAGGGGRGAGRTSPRGVRRSSSTYSSWDTSPSQACGFHTPVRHRTGGGLGREASAPAVSHLFHSPAAAAAEGSSASLASPKPPRHTHGRPPATVAAAMAAMHQQQQQHRVVSPRRASSDWSSYGAPHEHSGGSSAAQLPAAMVAALAADAEQAAEVHRPVRQRVNDTCSNATAAAEAQQFAAAEAAAADSDMQHPQPAPAVASDSAGQGTAANPDGQQQQQQQQQQLVAFSSSASLSQQGAAAPQQQQQQMAQGPLQQQAPTGLPMVPSSYQAHAAASSAAVASAAAASSSSYCRGPLSLAQPQMQAVSAAAAAAGGPGSNAAAAAAAAGGSSVGVHYQQLAAATAACHQTLQQLHGNVSQLSAPRSSGSIGTSSVTAAAAAAAGDMTHIPMGPLRSARAAAAAAAAANDPTRASFDRSTAAAGGSAAAAAAAGGAVSGIPAYRGHNGHVAAVAAGGVEAGMSNPARRQSSSNSGMMQVGNSWIVTPEGSCGLLLGGPLGCGSSGVSHAGLTAARSSTGGGCIAATAAAAAAAAAGPAQEGGAIAGPVACSMEPPCSGTAPLSARSSIVVQQQAAAAPPALAAERSHPAVAAAQQLHRQQQQLAGIAAAVAAGSYGGSSGPLQAPLLAQLGELSGKVSRLEDFVEAQVELIPDWQKALEVVQVVKRQADDHGHLLTEQDSKLATQADFVLELAGKVDGLGARLQAAQGAADRTGQQLAQLESQQTGLQEHLTQFEGQLAELTQQLTQQAAAEGARAAAGEAQVSSMVSQLDDTHSKLNATTARLSILEASLESSAADTKQQLLEQEQAVATATALATAATEAAANAAATAVAAAAAAGSGSRRGAAAASGDGSTAVPADPLAKQLAELQLQVGELSATVAGMSCASRVAAALGSSSSRRHGGSGLDEPEDGPPDSRALVPACEAGDVAAHTAAAAADAPSSLRAPSPELGEGLLPFMESTGACLAAHEAQIESLQALVPKLDGVVAQRAQLINLTEQVAALQTAFNMVPHGSRSSSHGGGGAGAGGASSSSHLPGLLPIRPLAAHKAAADTLSLATSMVKLQGQMGQLTLAVEGLRDKWEEAAEGLQAEREAARRDWEAERARIGSAEGEVARLLSEQQVEFAERETRLMQYRAAAAEAEEAAHLAALQSQQQVAGQMAALQAQQALMAQQLAATQASNEALRAELAAVQGQLAATAAAQAAMAEAQAAATAAMAAATAANMRQSASSLCEDLPAQRSSSVAPAAAAAATANDGSSSCRRHSEAASPAAAALPVAGSNAATGAGCAYPRVLEACSPLDNPFLAAGSSMPAAPEASAAAAAPAALAAAAAAAASDDAAARQPESSAEPRPAELAVLGQQQLVSGSVFGPGYFGTGSDGSRCGSSSANGSNGRHTLMSPCGSPSAGGLAAAASAAAAAVPGGADAAAAAAAETAAPRRRMTYDAVVAHAKSDLGNSYSSGMTDTFAAAGARSGAAITAGDCDGRSKLTWLAKVRQESSKGKAAAAATGSAAAAAAAGDVGRHRAEQKALAAAAAKAEKKLRKQLEQQQREQAHAVGKRSAGGALFGRWSKQARKAPADGAVPPEAAVLREWPAASEAAGAANQEQRPGCVNSSSSRDVRAGASCDQLLPAAAAAARGGADAWPAPAAAVTAAAAAEAGGKWRRLLGGRSAKA